MSRQNVGLIERFYYDMWNPFDKSIIPELLAEDLEFRGSQGQTKRGHSEFGEYMDFIQKAFPDFQNTLEDVESEGSQSFARLTYTGTHRGEVFGIAATECPIQYAGAALFEFRGNTIASVWVLGDIHGLLEPLRGAIPPVSG